ncbi:DUF4352 domain-containing protein [Mycobacterium alsense]|uniref:DUF4352 domain-containing protein n=1 Tax=Mycobacterium alsense TaxID=324058 RepID=UPI001FD0F7C1|nr:DUF4352 domain-containing protein [Mycobacterium alsense]
MLIVGIIATVVFVIVVGLILLVAISASIHGKQAAHSSHPAITLPSAPATPAMPSISGPPAPSSKRSAMPPATASLGQEVRDGRFAFTVTSADRSKTAGDLSNQFEIVTAQGEFLNVHMTVLNIGNDAQIFSATNQKLNIGNKIYEANSSAALWTQTLAATINPGNSIQAVVSFDVPPGSSGGTVQLHDSMFSGGVEVALS